MAQTRTILRNDLAPSPKVHITEGGNDYNLTGATIQFVMWLESNLKVAITDAELTLSVPAAPFIDEFFEVGMELLIDRERMGVAAPLPDWPYSGDLTVTVVRAQGGTAAEAHAADTAIQFFKIEAAGSLTLTPTDGIAKYDWVLGDTDMAGSYKCQYEIDPSGAGGKFSVPVGDTFLVVIDKDADDK